MTEPNAAELPGGLRAVLAWREAVYAPDVSRIPWVLLDDPLRLALAQAWIMNKSLVDKVIADKNREDLAYALAPRDADHPLLERMLTDEVHRWRSAYRAIQDGYGVLHKPQPVGPDLELVVLTGPEHVGSYEADAEIPVHTFVTRLVGNMWIIAALARRMPAPGWPPTEHDISGWS